MNHLSRTFQRVSYSTTAVKPLLPKTIKSLLTQDTTQATVRGWVRSVRKQKQVCFATINDGSNLKGIQVILNEKDAEL